MSLTSKVAIVTGGAMGIGFAVAQDLVGRGMSVVIADNQDARRQQSAFGSRAAGS